MPSLSQSALEVIDSLVTSEGWPRASAAPSNSEPIGRYSTLYGRDSLITALQVLPIRPAIAAATLRALGDRQGRRTNKPFAEEEGKILHEDWAEAPDWHRKRGWPTASDGSLRYFGSVDATPLFLILAARVGARGPTIDSALGWLRRSLSTNGLLTYEGPKTGGLYHQGWRDGVWDKSDVGVRWPDGSQVEGPVAVASAQAFAYEALRSHGLMSEANELAQAVDEAFFRHGEEWPALAVDGKGRAVPTMASEIGILLWSDILKPSRIEPAVVAINSLCSHWGLRTISPTHPCFSPSAYHLGAIWPFECWFAWGGLRRARAEDLARTVRRGVLQAIARLGLMPECYAAPLDNGDPMIPARATRTQAWTAGAIWALGNDWDGHVDVDAMASAPTLVQPNHEGR
jgi:glycogen debranching enzyme